jgi:pSer/pThr/pTyr-binding forkhead associated (FHA) protein
MDDCRPPAEACSLPLQGPHSAAPQAAFVPLRLVLRPGGTGVEVSRADVLIGRHSDADIRLAMPDVSRRHCRLVFTADRWQVFDLNSLNGLFVNGERVQQATLDSGDLIRIGGVTFVVELGPLPGAALVPQRKAS